MQRINAKYLNHNQFAAKSEFICVHLRTNSITPNSGYICNGAVVVPVAEADPDMDQQAFQEIRKHWPNREVIGIPMRAGPMQGGAVHCLTQQIPAV